MNTWPTRFLHRPAASPSRRERGQSLVEMSLMMSVILLLLAGVLDLGRAYFTYLALQDAAGEGAYFGSIHPLWWCANGAACSGHGNADPDNIEYRVKNSAPSGGLVNWSTPTVTVSGGTTPGQQMVVTASTNFHLVAPFIGAIAGTQDLTLTATSTAKVLSPGP